MKKVLSTVIAVAICFSVLQLNIAAASFTDMPEDHWAYSYVTSLVNDGTVSGYDDGEFKPDNVVTRAEFVKMIGKGATRRSENFNDVAPDFWGYEYIMYSGLEGTRNNFNPDVPITRNDVMELIWTRAGSKKPENPAPPVITGQAINKDAVSWAYMNGLIIGNDGVNLRLDETLTRAEGSAMIVRGREINNNTPQTNFMQVVPDSVLKHVYNSFVLFDDKDYDPDKTITNGEMVHAGIRLSAEEFNVTYKKYSVISPFDHIYSKSLYAMGNKCLSVDKINAEYIDQPATVKDTLTVLTYNTIAKAVNPPVFGKMGNYYKDVTSVDNSIMDKSLTFAYTNGIQFNSNGTINPNKAITLREFTLLLLQFDGLVGSQTATTTQALGNGYSMQDQSLQVNLDKVSSRLNDYQCQVADVPTAVYDAPFINITKHNNFATGIPKENYLFARTYGFIFVNMLAECKNSILSKSGVELRITYYPSMVCDNGKGYTMRSKIEVIQCEGEKNLQNLFALSQGVDGTMKLSKGSVIYADIVTGQILRDVYMPSDQVRIDQVVYTTK